MRGEQPSLGQHLRTARRSAQKAGANENCIMTNITEQGARYHKITPGDEVEVRVYEGGIVIRRVTDDE